MLKIADFDIDMIRHTDLSNLYKITISELNSLSIWKMYAYTSDPFPFQETHCPLIDKIGEKIEFSKLDFCLFVRRNINLKKNAGKNIWLELGGAAGVTDTTH